MVAGVGPVVAPMSRLDRWRTSDAAELAAYQKAVRDLPRCPNCGEPADPEMVKVLSFGDDVEQFLIVEVDCSARCWMRDPIAYLKAVSAMQKDDEIQ